MDLTEWTLQAGGREDLMGVTCGGGLFVAGGKSGALFTSTNATDWTRYTGYIGDHIYGLTYGQGRYVGIGYSTSFIYSDNGQTWTRGFLPGFFYPFGINYGNGLFVVVGLGGTIVTSPNGVNWAKQTSGVPYDLDEAVYGNGLYVAVGWNGTILTRGKPGESLTIETQEQLHAAGDWTPLMTLTLTNSVISVLDPAPPPGRRLYRTSTVD